MRKTMVILVLLLAFGRYLVPEYRITPSKPPPIFSVALWLGVVIALARFWSATRSSGDMICPVAGEPLGPSLSISGTRSPSPRAMTSTVVASVEPWKAKNSTITHDPAR